VKKINYDTVSEAVSDLLKRGYTATFNCDENQQCEVCKSLSCSLSAKYFKIDEVHRFEGITDPADQTIVYAISSKKFKVKGIVVNGYGIYADDLTAKIVQNLQLYSTL
jgi:hypothetical protein